MTDLRKELTAHLLDPFTQKTREDDITTGAKLALRAALGSMAWPPETNEYELKWVDGVEAKNRAIRSLLDSLEEEE